MREDNAHAPNHDLSAAAEIFANGTYSPNTLRTSFTLATFLSNVNKCVRNIAW